MKKIAYLVAFSALFFAVSCNNGAKTDTIWEKCVELEKQITTPVFSEQVFAIADFGAKAGDSLFLNTKFIQAAIDTCSKHDGGGKVLIPPGTYYTGPITLKSNVNLHLEEGAILRFSTDTALYKDVVLTRWEGMDCYNTRPLIYAYEETNIAITGKGTIDGQGSIEHWWWMKGPINDEDSKYKYGWKEGMPSQVTEGRLKLLNFEQNSVPLNERVLTTNDLLRPQLINFYSCKNILLDGMTLQNSPFWVIHPIFCENMTVRNLTIESHGPNSDGCDPESSKNILIENCLFDTGDDCIAIKSARNNDGRTDFNKPSENIIVRKCTMKDGHGGVVIGSEISGGFRNLFVEDCEMDSPNLDRVIRIKTNECRGGVIENIYVRNIKVGQCKEAILKINLLYEMKKENDEIISLEGCNQDFPPVVQNVFIENIISSKSKYGVYIVGLENPDNVNTIKIANCSFENVEKGNSINGATSVLFNNTLINGQKID